MVAVGALLLAVKSLDAGISGSPHDFSVLEGPFTQSSAIAPMGACSACHVPHGADLNTLWIRDLSSYRTLLEVNGGGTYSINYVQPPTIPCYDCHDTHTSGNIDDLPVQTGFSANHRPQDIAFGGDGPRGTPGYYENNPPDNTYQKGADPNLNPNDSVQLARTGGHYFKYRDPDGAGSLFRKGDKLSCRDCHDPHIYSSTWRVFIRADLPNAGDVILSSVYGSELMTNLSTGSHDNASSRRICVSCHSYSNTSTTPVRYNQVDAAYTDTSAIPKPPATVGEHSNSPSYTYVPCVSCHKHNYIDANCSQCHGFPPSPYPPARNSTPTFGAYSARDPHPQHVGRGDGQPPNSVSVYGFECTVCHATSALGSRTVTGTHNTGAYNIAFDLSALGVANPPDATSSGRWTCSNVYCHSNGGSDNTMNGTDNYFRTVQWGVTPAPLSCNGCHGVGTASGTPQFGMPNYASGPAGSATANSHARHVAQYECSVCHVNTVTGTYSSGRSIPGPSNAWHVNGGREVAFDGTNATGSYNVDNAVQANNKRCDVSCHGTGRPLLERPQWGGSVNCFGCHLGTESIYKPQDNVGLPNPVDNGEYLYSGHGRSGSNYPVSGNAPAGFGNYATAPADCYYCHSQTAPHDPPDRTNDPFRLGTASDPAGQKGTLQGPFGDNTDLLCLGCHGTAAQRGSNPNAAQGTTTVDALTHARHVMSNPKYAWPGPNYPWKCVDCHDPHGDGKSGAERIMMIRSGINAPIDVSDTAAGSDAKARTRRTDANVRSVTFNSLSGFGAGSYAQSGNGTGGTWGPCEVCHTQTTAYSRTGDNDNTHVTRITRCTTCHPHKSGFAATACKGCHGPDSVATAAAAPDVGAYWASSGHGMTSPKTINIDCEACHDVGFVTGADHKADGTAGAGPPPANINTQVWPGKTETAPNSIRNQNTAHLASSYFPAGFPTANPSNKYLYPLAFDQKCGNPASGCHPARPHYDPTYAPNGAHPQRPASPTAADNVLTFGQSMTTANPKAYYWYPSISDYPSQFYQSRSPWDIEDITTRATGMAVPDSGVRYGVCVSCHDPHGTNAPVNRPGKNTNVMLRGDTLNQSQFCNTACHTTRTPP